MTDAISNVIIFPRAHRDDPGAVKREVRKRLGRDRLQQATPFEQLQPTLEASAHMIELRGVVRQAMAMISDVAGAETMTKWVEQDLAAWKVRSCTNE